MPANENMQNMLPRFSCKTCDYSCSKKSSWDQHLLTLKHKNANFSAFSAKNAKNNYACDTCDKSYKHPSSYSRHKKTCKSQEKNDENDAESDSESENNDEPTEKELIMMLIKQNTQLIEQNASLVKNGVTNTTTTNSHNNHSHNKTFNLQFFLNETCKDAMNLTDFVNSIQLQVSDLEKMGEIGYTQGLSNIIINNLNELDVTQRPVHCADKKREVIYVKDENKWEKEQEDKKKIRKAIRRIADKNCCMLKEYKKLHPDCAEYHSKYGDKYNKMMYEAYGGKGDNEIEKENKIIRNIAKNVTIDKMN